MKVKEVGRGPRHGFFSPLALCPGAVPSLWPVLGNLVEVSLRPQGQGWAVITSGKARSGTSQTTYVSYKVYQTQACGPPLPRSALSSKPALEKGS